MSWRFRPWMLAIAAALAVSASAEARDAAAPAPGAQHPPDDSISYSTWAIDGPVVRLQVILPTAEAAKLAGPHAAAPDAAAVSEAVAAAVGANSRGGPCPAVDLGEGEGKIYRLALTPGLSRFEVIFLCPSADGITLSNDLLFARAPRHIDFARVQIGAHPPFAEMFTRGHRTFPVPAADAAQGGSNTAAFLRQGASNMAGHADWLLVIAGIVLVCRQRRDLAFAAGGIAIGQAAAAALAAWGLAIEWPTLTGAATGLFVAALGAAALRFHIAGKPALPRGWRIASAVSLALAVAGAIFFAGRMGPSWGWPIAGVCIVGLAMLWGANAAARPHWLVWFPALLLGLLNGMTIGTNLAVLAMPAATFMAPLAGWMVGAFATAIAFAAAAMFVLWLIERRWRSSGELVAEIAGAGMIGSGLFWFVSRLWS